jgi:hypothetical protein
MLLAATKHSGAGAAHGLAAAADKSLKDAKAKVKDNSEPTDGEKLDVSNAQDFREKAEGAALAATQHAEDSEEAVSKAFAPAAAPAAPVAPPREVDADRWGAGNGLPAGHPLATPVSPSNDLPSDHPLAVAKSSDEVEVEPDEEVVTE